MGLPTLLLVLAENQSTVATALENIGAAVVLDNYQTLSQVFEKHTQSVAIAQLKSLTLAAAGVSDGLGVQRMLEAMRTELQHG